MKKKNLKRKKSTEEGISLLAPDGVFKFSPVQMNGKGSG
jgi:hypothetical protein